MTLTLITPPNALNPAITLDEAKDHLRVLHSDEDNYIVGLISAATALLQDATHYYPIQQTWQISLPTPPRGNAPIYFPLGPLTSVLSVTYHTSDDPPIVWQPTEYYVQTGLMGAITPRGGIAYPSVQAGRLESLFISFIVGHATTSEVPEQIKHAIKIMLSTLFWERGKEPPHGIIRRLMSGYAHPGSMVQ